MKTNYNILITPSGEQPYTITLETSDLEWSMEQYGRNRGAFTFEVIKEWQ